MRYTRFVPLTLAALVAASCSGSHHSSITSGTAPTTTSSVSTGSGGGTSSATSATSASAGGGATGATGGATQSTNATTTTAAAPQDKTANPPNASTAPQPATAGTYQERQSGSFTAVGSTKTVPPQGTLVIDAAQATGKQVWHRFVQPGQPSDETTLQFTGRGPFLLSTTEPSPQGTVTCTFNPPIPAPTWPAAMGDTFSSTGDCGQFTVSVSGRINGQRNVALNGHTYSTWVVDTTLTFHGSVSGSGTQEDWYSTDLRVPLHEYSQLHGSYGPFSFSSNMTSDVTSIP